MPVITQHRFSTTEYHRMAETGVLRPDARVELLDGQIIDMSPIGPFHGGVVKFLNQVFTLAANRRWMVAVQDPLHLDDLSEPEPDLMLLNPAPDGYRTRHPGPSDVLLLIEVGDTSVDYDRGEKLPAYGRAGIPECWLVDLNERSIEVYREPHLTGYGSMSVMRRGDKVRPAALPDVAIDVAELLNT